MSESLDSRIQALPLNAQFRDELRSFAGDRAARLRALALAMALGAALLATWPAGQTLELGRVPLAYKVTGGLALLMVTYLALIGGLLAKAGHGKFTVRHWAAFVPLKPGAYLRGALAGQMLEPVFVILVLAPLLAPAAIVEGATGAQFCALLLLLASSALTARLLALTLKLALETRPLALMAAGHAALAGIFGVGELAWKPLGPWAAFLGTLSDAGGGASAWLLAAWPGFLATHALLDGALFALAWCLVLGLRRRAGGPPAAPAQH